MDDTSLIVRTVRDWGDRLLTADPDELRDFIVVAACGLLLWFVFCGLVVGVHLLCFSRVSCQLNPYFCLDLIFFLL